MRPRTFRNNPPPPQLHPSIDRWVVPKPVPRSAPVDRRQDGLPQLVDRGDDRVDVVAQPDAGAIGLRRLEAGRRQRGMYRLRTAVAVRVGRTPASRSSSTVMDENVDWSASRSRYRLQASAKSVLPAGWMTT
jgi:hypothetical protein